MKKNIWYLLSVLIVILLFSSCMTNTEISSDPLAVTTTATTTDNCLSETTTVLSETLATEKLPESAKDNPEVATVYRALLNNQLIWCSGNTIDLTLIDIDFDNIPELVVSYGNNQSDQYDINVSFYSIENDNIIPVTTIEHFSNDVITLHTFDDGIKSWLVSTKKADQSTGEFSEIYSLISFREDNTYTNKEKLKSIVTSLNNVYTEEYFIDNKPVLNTDESKTKYNDAKKALFAGLSQKSFTLIPTLNKNPDAALLCKLDNQKLADLVLNLVDYYYKNQIDYFTVQYSYN